MKSLFKSILLLFTIVTLEANAQNINSEVEFLFMKRYSVAIGEINVINRIDGKVQRIFTPIGSGLMTYIRLDSSTILNTVVTAGHIVKHFLNNNKSIFIRPSWADTIRTTDYFGIEIPLINSDGTPNCFLHPKAKIDLGCVVLSSFYWDTTFKDQLNKETNVVFPINQMTKPNLGSEVWICGYPSHIESNFLANFSYNIATFKPGHVTWKPYRNMANDDLYHITLVESNATFGNSGSPVFCIANNLELIGILVSGYTEDNLIFSNGKAVVNPQTNQPLVSQSRAGVSIIENAEFARELLTAVKIEILSIINSSKSK